MIYLTKNRYRGPTCVCGNNIRLKKDGSCAQCKRGIWTTNNGKILIIVAGTFEIARNIHHQMLIRGDVTTNKFTYADGPHRVKGWDPRLIRVILGPGHTDHPEVLEELKLLHHKYGIVFNPE